MKKNAYKLHAVLVHQGQASGGHYWAYVKRRHTLSTTSMEEIARDKETLVKSREIGEGENIHVRMVEDTGQVYSHTPSNSPKDSPLSESGTNDVSSRIPEEMEQDDSVPCNSNNLSNQGDDI